MKKNGLEQAKQQIFDIRDGKKRAKDSRFHNHLRKLPNESLIDLQLWFPEDALQITYGKTGKKIREGSPGQKSAALLTFILAHGNEPLLLDQPEDDLDNELIYSLIVQAIKANKTKRQIIVVTHNANIVVNGDSEMVHYLNVANGQSHLKSDSLQSEAIRQRIAIRWKAVAKPLNNAISASIWKVSDAQCRTDPRKDTHLGKFWS